MGAPASSARGQDIPARSEVHRPPVSGSTKSEVVPQLVPGTHGDTGHGQLTSFCPNEFDQPGPSIERPNSAISAPSSSPPEPATRRRPRRTPRCARSNWSRSWLPGGLLPNRSVAGFTDRPRADDRCHASKFRVGSGSGTLAVQRRTKEAKSAGISASTASRARTSSDRFVS